MEYATLMVNLEPGRSNTGVLSVANELAVRFQASVVGIAVCQPMQMIYGDGFISGDLIEQDRDEIAKEMKEVESEFHNAMKTRGSKIEWRSEVTLTSLSQHLANEARCADLIITRSESGSSMDKSREINTGDLVMQAGRPVLIVPSGISQPRFEKVLVGWKDTRETRRAVFDALPLLQKVPHVVVVEISKENDLPATRIRLADVVVWLKRHDVKAEYVEYVSVEDDSTQLTSIALDQRADVIVAGAYGHSRLREWVLGGVTQDLLLCSDCCSLVSH